MDKTKFEILKKLETPENTSNKFYYKTHNDLFTAVYNYVKNTNYKMSNTCDEGGFIGYLSEDNMYFLANPFVLIKSPSIRMQAAMLDVINKQLLPFI